MIKYSACDGANNDGVVEFPSVTVGNYTVHETKAPNPSSWYIVGADQNDHGRQGRRRRKSTSPTRSSRAGSS